MFKKINQLVLIIGIILIGLGGVLNTNNGIFSSIPKVLADPNTVSINQNFNAVQTNLTGMEFGTNQFDYSFDTGNNPAYIDNMTYFKPGLIRVHYGEMLDDSALDPKGWVKNSGWDRPKIKAWANQMKSLRTKFGFEIMINIPGFPSFAPQSNPGVFGDFVADLVRIVNIEEGLKVKFLEITNELDDDNPAGGLNAAYNSAAIKSKAVDPSIKTGGLAFQRPDFSENVRSFIDGTLAAGTLDFVSYHAYAGPGGGTKIDYFNRRIDYAASFITNDFKSYLASKNASNMPVFQNESNICYVYTCGDPGMTNQTGAVYDALGYILHLEAGGSGVMTWNEKDTFYGKMGNDYTLRPSAHVHHSLNLDRPDKIIQSQKTNDITSSIKEFSFISKSGKKGIFIVNRGVADLPIQLIPSGGVGDSVFHSVIGGIYTVTNKTAAQTIDFTIPKESVLTIFMNEPAQSSSSLSSPSTSSSSSFSSSSSSFSSPSLSSSSSSLSSSKSSSSSSSNLSTKSSGNSSLSLESSSTSIKISDPYICGENITGKIDGNIQNKKVIVEITNQKGVSTILNPPINKNGEYEVKGELIPSGLYTVKYSVENTIGGQKTSGVSYIADIKTPQECSINDTKKQILPRTGSVEIVNYFNIFSILIFCGFYFFIKIN